MNNSIKVGFCIAYDWYLLRYSLPLVYHHADLICISIDKDRISWSGHPYEFSKSEFDKLINGIDLENKIKIFEDDFHLASLKPMENEVRQRNLLANFLGEGGWHIQLDCDEYFLQFGEFVKYLRDLPANAVAKANVCCCWVVLYKQLNEGFLYVDPIRKDNIELIQIASKNPVYEYGRMNGNFNLVTNFKILHQSWARTTNEIREKINNWGHSNDFEKRHYLEIWETLNKENFMASSNFHYLKPKVWPKLGFVKANSLEDLLQSNDLLRVPQFSRADLAFINSRFFSKVRKVRDILIKRWAK